MAAWPSCTMMSLIFDRFRSKTRMALASLLFQVQLSLSWDISLQQMWDFDYGFKKLLRPEAGIHVVYLENQSQNSGATNAVVGTLEPLLNISAHRPYEPWKFLSRLVQCFVSQADAYVKKVIDYWASSLYASEGESRES